MAVPGLHFAQVFRHFETIAIRQAHVEHGRREHMLLDCFARGAHAARAGYGKAFAA